ncbi:MAG: hypothetical protein K9L19_18350 [Desulfarculaceae bacterium]|nr:hypothetical protein [Desulfarculaceae bacterium]MCF8049515.1 hypothetical protein [Desulfarculaceae bacterium]
MARKSKWNEEDRKKLIKMVNDGVSEQEIRGTLAHKNEAMSSVEFAQQLKMSMVESGIIKQEAPANKKKVKSVVYEVTPKGRLSLNDFTDKTGFQAGANFTLEKPRGRSNAWRLVPVK